MIADKNYPGSVDTLAEKLVYADWLDDRGRESEAKELRLALEIGSLVARIVGGEFDGYFKPLVDACKIRQKRMAAEIREEAQRLVASDPAAQYGQWVQEPEPSPLPRQLVRRGADGIYRSATAEEVVTGWNEYNLSMGMK